MKLVIDTNVLFSALYRPDSNPGKIIMLAIEGDLELHAPDTVREEMFRILVEKLRYEKADANAATLALPVTWAPREQYEDQMEVARAAIRDESDAPVVALALALHAPVLSGDADFHPLKKPVVETLRPRGDLAQRAGGE